MPSKRKGITRLIMLQNNYMEVLIVILILIYIYSAMNVTLALTENNAESEMMIVNITLILCPILNTIVYIKYGVKNFKEKNNKNTNFISEIKKTINSL